MDNINNKNIVIPDIGYINGIAQESRINNLSEEQEKALDFIDTFMKDNTKKYAVIGGIAGSGKSSLIPYIVNKYSSYSRYNNINNSFFNDMIPDIVICAYTGKAVMVLKRKGVLSAQTLHSFLYTVKKEKDKEGNIKINFIAHPYEHFTGIKLLIVDEASMVNKNMFEMINKLPFKTLYIGDHFQLPPVGDTFNIMLYPDYKLEKVLRQNEDNPIIMLSELARNGKSIPLGIFNNSKHTRVFNEEELLDYNEVITWTNVMKDSINNIIRDKLGYEKDIPHIEDKMIIKANYPLKNVYNGQIVYIMNNPLLNKQGAWEVEFIDELAHDDVFIMAQTNEYTKAKASIHLSKEELDKIRLEPYNTINKYVNGKLIKSYKKNNPYEIHLDWGYALTCHSSQGSSWKHVAIIDENKMHYMKDYNRWLYTCITRAEESVVIYSGDFNKYYKK